MAKYFNTNVIPGSYTSANITVDVSGLLTAAANGSGGSAVIMDNLASGNLYPTAPQTEGIWYGQHSKSCMTGSAGSYSIVIGNRTAAAPVFTVGLITAIGGFCTLNGTAGRQTAVGYNATANDQSVSVGINTISSVSGVSIGIAAGNSGAGDNAVLVGSGAWGGIRSVAIGPTTNADQDSAIAIGSQASSQGLRSISIGTQSNATAQDSIALGRFIMANVTDGFFVRHRNGVTPTAARVAVYDNASNELVGLPYAAGAGYVLTSNSAGAVAWAVPSGGSGTVTSVTAGNGLNVGAGPGGTITGSGTLNLSQNCVAVGNIQFAGVQSYQSPGSAYYLSQHSTTNATFKDYEIMASGTIPSMNDQVLYEHNLDGYSSYGVQATLTINNSDGAAPLNAGVAIALATYGRFQLNNATRSNLINDVTYFWFGGGFLWSQLEIPVSNQTAVRWRYTNGTGGPLDYNLVLRVNQITRN